MSRGRRVCAEIPAGRSGRACRLLLRTGLFAALGLWPGLSGGQTAAPSRPGWPVTLTGALPMQFSKPLVADLDNDGTKEIIVGTSGGNLYVLNANGTIRAGWPKTLPSEIASSPAVGDLDGDGLPDIVIGCGSNTDLAKAGGVFAFRRDGTLLWQFSPRDTDGNGQPDHVWSTPAIGDINGDGHNDVVFGSWDFYVYALDGRTGQPLSGWPVFVRDSVWSSPALADLDGNGTLEIVIGADCHAEGSPIDTPNGGALFVFRADGTNFPGFPRFATDPLFAPVGIDSSPAVGDIDGDGCPEIIVGTGNSTSSGGKKLYAWHNDGSLVSGWPLTLAGHPVSSPALADLNGDGILDVVISDDAAFLYGIRGNGTVLFQMKPKTYTGASAVSVGDPVLAQVGSQNPAILVGGVGFDVTIVSKSGVQISDDGSHGAGMLTYTTGHPVTGPVAADLDGNGTLNIIAASGVSAVDTTSAKVFVWTAGASGSFPWPAFRRDVKRAGWASPPAVCPFVAPRASFYTLMPCRVSDSRQSGYLTYGGPALVAGEQRTITLTGVCGIPSTARSVALNVTVTNPSNFGDLRLFPGGDGSPMASVINFRLGQTRANNAILPLSYDGRGHLTVQVDMPSGRVDVILDVTGYFQ
jgi:VCBS repeat protein